MQTNSAITDLWEDAAARDEMLKIGRLYPRFTIFTEFASQETFAKAIGKRSPTLINELSNCFLTTNRLEKITQSVWPEDLAFHTKMVESCYIPLDYLENEFKESMKAGDEQEMQIKPISVRVLDMQWFYTNNHNFVAFSRQLEDMPNSLYSSEFIECLLEENWDALQKTIIIKLFIPYLLYAFSSTFYMKLALAVD